MGKDVPERRADDRPVLIYCRESRDENCAEYERIETQRDILLEFCRRQGLWNVVDVVMDDDTTGTSFQRFRPIIERVRKGEIRVLVFKDSSRLGRNLRESLNFVDFLESCGAEILFESEAYDEDFFPLKAWFNEQRAKEDSLKIRRVLKHKMEAGTLLVKPKYGYRRGGEGEAPMMPREDTANIVRWIFMEVQKGGSLSAVAEELNTRRVPTPSQAAGLREAAAFWAAQHIRRIVTDPVYTGVMIHNRKTTKSYKNKKVVSCPREEWIVIEDHHPPLVSREEFDAVQEMRRKVKFTKPARKERPFSGILQCGRCGQRLVLRQRKGRPDAYICGRNHREGTVKGDRGCLPHHVRESVLYEVTREYVRRLFQSTGMDLQTLLRQSAQETAGRREEINLQRQLEKTRQIIGRIYDDRLNGTVSESLFREKYAEYREAERRLTERLRKMREETAAAKKLTELQGEDIINYSDEMLFSKELVRILFDRIVVYESDEIRDEPGLIPEELQLLRERGGLLFIENGKPAP